MLLATLLPVLLLLTFLCPAPALSSEQTADVPTIYRLDRLDGCPVDFSSSTQAVNFNQSNDFFKAADVAEYRCQQDDDPSRYFMYPKNNRTCFENGTWSGPPPICADNTTMKNSPLSTVAATYDSLIEDTLDDSWMEIGFMHSDCYDSKNNDNKEHDFKNKGHQRLSHTYTRHLSFKSLEYFSVATINVPENLMLADVAVFARDNHIIREFAQDAKCLQEVHYNDYVKKHMEQNARSQKESRKSPIKHCAVLNLSVYSDELVVRYTVSSFANEQKTPAAEHGIGSNLTVRFYPILTEKDDSKKEQQSQKKVPLIPNAIYKTFIDQNDRTVIVVQYNCLGDRVLIDPLTNLPSTGTIRCSKGKCKPYPLPVCRRLYPFENSITSNILVMLVVANFAYLGFLISSYPVYKLAVCLKRCFQNNQNLIAERKKKKKPTKSQQQTNPRRNKSNRSSHVAISISHESNSDEEKWMTL